MQMTVDRAAYRTADPFCEPVARNRGFDIRHFYALDEPLAWLLD